MVISQQKFNMINVYLYLNVYCIWPRSSCGSGERRWNRLLALVLGVDSQAEASDHSLPAIHQKSADPPHPPVSVSVSIPADHDTVCSALPAAPHTQRHPQPQDGC